LTFKFLFVDKTETERV